MSSIVPLRVLRGPVNAVGMISVGLVWMKKWGRGRGDERDSQ